VKKYKLIKTYPGSNSLGTIVSAIPHPEAGAQSARYIDSSNKYYGWHEIEDYPEFWEEIKEPQFKVGGWVMWEKEKMVRKIKSLDPFEWYNDFDDGSWLNRHPNEYRLAINDEIEACLIKEAEKRGFVTGTKYKYPDIPSIETRTIKCNKFKYNPKWDILYEVITGSNIYYENKWAEIVEEEEIKISEYEVKFNSSYISIGCKKYSFIEVRSLYENCLTFGINSIIAYNHITVDFAVIKKIYDRIK